MTRDENLRGSSRRDFIRGVFAASAALGVGPLRALELLDREGGSALAQEACRSTARVINVIAGTGGFAWFNLLWPCHRVMNQGFAMSNVVNSNVATLIPGNDANVPTNQPLYAWKVNGQPLFARAKREMKVTAVVGGRAFAHQIAPSITNNTNTIADGVGGDLSAFAAMAALQNQTPTLLPVIGVQFNGVDMPYRPTVRPVPEAPAQATVLRGTNGSADGIIGLFSSAAAQVVDRLGVDPMTKKSNAPLFSQYYRAFQSLSRTALRPTYQATTNNERLALKVVSTNMASALAYTTAGDNTTALDLSTVVGAQIVQMAGANQASAKMVMDFARSLIVAYKAFREGLTAQINLPAFNDDPHPAFANGTALPIATGLAMALDWFMNQMAATPDPFCPGKTLSDNLVMTFTGDMPKSPFSSTDDWNDSPPQSANWIYIVHNGELKPGWFGNVEPGRKRHWDPVNNKPTPDTQEQGSLERPLAGAGLAGAVLAVAKGDKAMLRQVFTGRYEFLVP